jgi:hypothetical protein
MPEGPSIVILKEQASGFLFSIAVQCNSCPRCEIPLVKAHLGKKMRRSFFCENCQLLYR